MPIKLEYDNEKENQILKVSPPLLSGLNFTPEFSTSSPPRAAQGDGEWGLWPVHHTLSLLLLPPHSLPLLQHEAPLTGDSCAQISKVSPSHGLQFFTNCPSVGPFTMRCSPSGADCSSVGPPWGHKPCQQTCSSMGSSFHAATGPGRSLLQRGLSTGSQPASGILLLQRGLLLGLQVNIFSTVDLHGLQGDSLPQHGLHYRLQGNLCSGTWTTSSPSFFTDLGVCRVVSLTFSHSSLLPQNVLMQVFFPFLNTLSQRCYHHH